MKFFAQPMNTAKVQIKRGDRFLSSSGPCAWFGASSNRSGRSCVGDFWRLQALARRLLRTIRSGSLRCVYLGSDVWTAGLRLAHFRGSRGRYLEVVDWISRGPSLLFAYAFGKTQRILAELGKITDRVVYLHGSCETLTKIYRDEGIQMVPTKLVSEMPKDYKFAGDLVLAPPSGHRSTWMKRFKNPQTAFASGWMQIRGNRRRRGYERGFVLSDHADWKDLVSTILATGAKKVLLTHGNTDALERYLREEKGLNCENLATQFEGEAEA